MQDSKTNQYVKKFKEVKFKRKNKFVPNNTHVLFQCICILNKTK